MTSRDETTEAIVATVRDFDGSWDPDTDDSFDDQLAWRIYDLHVAPLEQLMKDTVTAYEAFLVAYRTGSRPPAEKHFATVKKAKAFVAALEVTDD